MDFNFQSRPFHGLSALTSFFAFVLCLSSAFVLFVSVCVCCSVFFMLRATKILLVYLLFLEQVATVVTPAAFVFSVYMHCIKRLAEGRQSIKSFSHFNCGLYPAAFQLARTKTAINMNNIMFGVVRIKFCKHSDNEIGKSVKEAATLSFSLRQL